MELMQLEMFVAMVEERSVVKTAKRVCRTPPAVSMALRKLEQEAGTPLFDRSRRYDHRLTPAGKLLWGYARDLISLRNEAVSALRSIGQANPGEVRLGAG